MREKFSVRASSSTLRPLARQGRQVVARRAYQSLRQTPVALTSSTTPPTRAMPPARHSSPIVGLAPQVGTHTLEREGRQGKTFTWRCGGDGHILKGDGSTECAVNSSLHGTPAAS